MSVRFSILMAVYNVEGYLEATMRSLKAQTYGFSRLEVIAVDDGSTDGSLEILRRWERRYRNVRVITQQNGGPGAARSTALRHATGEWVTVVDPDDLVARDYFTTVDGFLQRDGNQRAHLLATRVYLLNDVTGHFKDTHPLAQKFRFGDRLARLADEPAAFQLGATAFLKRAVLVEHGLDYDPRVRPTFEDAHLIARYLGTFDDPIVGLVATAHYYYRKRQDASSAVQTSWALPERFSAVPRYGYLDLVDWFKRRGAVPVWVQYIVLYDLIWYLKEDQLMYSKVGWVDGPLRDDFLRTLDAIMTHIDREVIERFACNPHSWTLRQSLLVRFDKIAEPTPLIYRWGDHDGLSQLSVLYRGEEPDISVHVDGVPVSPRVRDYTVHNYYGQEFMVEERLSVPSGAALAVFVDGVFAPTRKVRPVSWGRPPKAAFDLAPREASGRWSQKRRRLRALQERAMVQALTQGTGVPRVVSGKVSARRDRRAEAGSRNAAKILAARLTAASQTPAVREKYRDAWVLMDRPGRADDNAEHLYRYLQRERPDVNAWFLLNSDSPDWSRLSGDGFRLIPYGSDEAVLLVHNAIVGLSSEATADVMYPAGRKHYRPLPRRFVFLQHGITMNDLSRWLNPKDISLIITSARGEHESFVGRHSPYRVGKQQVPLTGMARFDSLSQTRREVGTPKRLLVMPTWRNHIARELAALPEGRRAEYFAQTEYWRRWRDALSNAGLRDLAASHGIVLSFLFHPSLDALLGDVDLPEGVEQLRYEEISFQEVLTDTSALLTDYSSVSFDAAYVGIPVLYYQFDKAEVFSGAHSFRAGYFDYDRDGLGPVESELDDVLVRLRTIAQQGFTPEPEFLQRVDKTFEFRDERNRARIVSSVERMLAETSEADQ